MASLAKKWQDLKLDYEAATEKKKPSDKFLGIFNKKSGLEAAFKAFDSAVKANDYNAVTKAFGAAEKAADAYQTILSKAAAAEKNKEIIADTKTMSTGLTRIIEEAKADKKKAGQVDGVKTLSDFSKMLSGPAADRVKAAVKKELCEPTFNFLIAMTKKDHSPKVYKEFVKENAINISGALLKKFDPQDLDKAPWDAATADVLQEFNFNIIARINTEARSS